MICLREKRAKAASKPKNPGKVTSSRRTESSHAASRSAASGALAGRRRAATSSSVKVTKLTRHAGDGWSHELLPGLSASRDAHDLLRQLSRARVRLDRLATDAPGPYATARALAGGEAEDREEAAWILFQTAYYGPLEGGEPFREIDRLLVRWDEALPDAATLRDAQVGRPFREIDRLLVRWDEALPDAATLRDAQVGPRGAHAHDRGEATLQGYREWARKVGGQLKGLGAGGTDPARRFDAAYRALALPGLARPARYEFVVTLGRLGLVDVNPWSLLLDAGRDPVSVAAKRAFLTGDAVLLQRRFGAFQRELGIPVAAFDLGLLNWDLRPSPTAPKGYLEAGVPCEPDADEVVLLGEALGLPGDDVPGAGAEAGAGDTAS